MTHSHSWHRHVPPELRRATFLRAERKNVQCVSNKRCFKTRGRANQALADIRRIARRNQDSLPIRSYQCPHCKCWHLTSKPKRTTKQPENRSADRKTFAAEDQHVS
jgi:hypothetical protein